LVSKFSLLTEISKQILCIELESMSLNLRYRPLKKRSRNLAYQQCLEGLSTLPKNVEVYQRYKSLQAELNGKRKSSIIYSIAHEIVNCWKNQDMPTQIYQTVKSKINRLIQKGESIFFYYFDCNLLYYL